MVAVASMVMFYKLMNFSIVILEVLWDLTMEKYGTDDVQGETNAAHDQDQHRILNSCMLL
jgi:hypothetical protein